MDNEHRRLAVLFDEFKAAMNEEDSLERAQAIVEEALALTNEHFEHEEELMVRTAYPAIEEEKFHHRNLRLQFTTLVGDALSNGASDPVTLENHTVLQHLLIEHIIGPDRELANYLIARGLA
jgi:hemerythrin